MLYYLKNIILGIMITALSFIFDFYYYYQKSFDVAIEKLQWVDQFTKQYILLVLLFAIAFRITYDTLPIKKVYFPMIITLIALFSPIPRLFKILFTLLSMSIFFSYETYNQLKSRKDQLRSDSKK